MAVLLDVKDLTKNFGGLAAVSDVNMHLDDNELVALIGPNGAGKTTLFNLMTGQTPPSAGSVTLRTNDGMQVLNGKRPYTIADMGLARTFQNIRLFKNLTVLDNVLISMTSKNKESLWSSLFRTPKFYRLEAQMQRAALDLLSIFDMQDMAYTLAANMPYGAQRRLEIIRALATKPKILFLDEPAAGMNPEETAALTVTIRQIQKDFGITVLLIEHDMSLVMNVAERIYVLQYGKLLAEGTPKEIQTNQSVIDAYLGGGV